MIVYSGGLRSIISDALFFMQPFINLSVEDYDAFYCLQLLDVFFSLLGCDWLLCNLFSCWKLFMKSQTICEY